MGYSWKNLRIRGLNGLQLKINPTDVPDGTCIDANNVYQGADGVVAKRKGNSVMFGADETSTTRIDAIGSVTLSTVKYWFKIAGGVFKYTTSLNGTTTTIAPGPPIATGTDIWWVVLDNKMFFVDGSANNSLRYFDGTQILTSSIYQRPTNPATTASGGAGFDYTYTADNGLGESPACATLLLNVTSAASIVIFAAAGPFALVPGNTVRIYSKATGVASNFRLVATYIWLGFGSETIPTVAISDDQTQLYSDIGLALNKAAPVGLKGITEHYGRLIGWKDDSVYCSKVSNPHSWPDEQAVQEAFVYEFAAGDSESVKVCISFRESLFVLKDTKIAIFVGVGPDDAGGNRFSFRRLETYGIGCFAPKSAVIIGEANKAFLIFLSRQGFYGSDGNEPRRLGEAIESEVVFYGQTALQTCQAVYHKRAGFYYAVLGAEGSRRFYVFDTREDNGRQVGWFRLDGIDAASLFYDSDRLLIGTYDGVSLSERISDIGSDYQDVKYEYFATTSVNVALDRITVTQSYTTGDTVVIRSTGSVPGGLTANTVYYIIAVSSTVIKLASSLANALISASIDITGAGSGTHSIIGSKAISGYYVTNFMNFGSPSHVKKVSKPSIIINAQASAVNIMVQTAYDWVRIYEDDITISTGSTHLWGAGLWGSFLWGAGSQAVPKNIGIARRKFRSISYKFSNSTINQDFNLQGIEQLYSVIRNRGNYSE